MRIVVLRGVGNVGKTTTLKLVIDKCKCLVSNHSIDKYHDSIGIFEYSKDNRTYHFIICTAGDFAAVYDAALDYYRKFDSKYHFDALITASRSRGETMERLKSFAKDNGNMPLVFYDKGYILSFHIKDSSSVIDYVNNLEAEIILHLSTCKL